MGEMAAEGMGELEVMEEVGHWNIEVRRENG